MTAISHISVIGSGNVATHLSVALQSSGISITHVVSRNASNASVLAKKVNATVVSLSELPKDQPALICVSDDAIGDVILEISPQIPVAYTSGSVEIKSLPQRDQIGVFYPLQTFSKNTEVDIRRVPLLIEANSESWQNRLLELAKTLSTSVHVMNSEKRAHLHLAAVWINNFTNHMVYQAQKFASSKQLNYALLLPLLEETVNKLQSQTPFDAQTGPARRGDEATIEKHLSQLDGTTQELYALLTDSIQETYKNEKL